MTSAVTATGDSSQWQRSTGLIEGMVGLQCFGIFLNEVIIFNLRGGLVMESSLNVG